MKKLLPILVLFFLIGCKKEEIGRSPTVYKIPKGGHFSLPKRQMLPLNSHKVESIWVFNSTAIYTPDINQDENKLTGIRFFSKSHPFHPRYNVAMIAWRYIDGNIELSPYLHREGSIEFVEKLNCCRVPIEMNKEVYTKIEVTKDSVFFVIKDTRVSFSFPAHGDLCWVIQPYFGGQAIAPHDIIIQKL